MPNCLDKKERLGQNNKVDTVVLNDTKSKKCHKVKKAVIIKMAAFTMRVILQFLFLYSLLAKIMIFWVYVCMCLSPVPKDRNDF